MATTATLLALPVTGAKSNHLSTSLESTKRKNQESLMSNRKKQPVQSDESSPTRSTMITEYEMNNEDGELRANGSAVVSRTTTLRTSIEKSTNQMFFKTENSSMPLESSKPIEIPITNDQFNSDSQVQGGKRKLSVSQYKEHKRLKSSEVENGCGDVDMRIHFKPPSPPINNTKLNVESTSVELKMTLTNRALETGVTKKSNLSEPGFKNSLKKKVIWADEKQQELVQTSFFEIDETERLSKRSFVQQFANSNSLGQLEQTEGHFLHRQNHRDCDDRRAQTPLPTLIRIHLPSTIPNPVVKSHQRIVQENRERTVLQAFIGSFIPESPAEPDSTEDCSIETKLIPLEDDSSTQVTSEPQTASISPTISNDSKENPLASLLSSSKDSTISPQVAQILAAARGNIPANTSTIPNINSSIPSTNPVVSMPVTTPNFLSAFLAGTQNVNIQPMNPLANLLSSFPLSMNPLSSLLSAVNQPWTNGLTATVPTSTPIAQTQQISPGQTLNPSQNFSNPTNEAQLTRRDQTGLHQHNASKFPNKHFNQRPNPNYRKQNFRRGPVNGHRRNFFSDRNTFD